MALLPNRSGLLFSIPKILVSIIALRENRFRRSIAISVPLPH
jgi:hypothetical protein